MNEIAIETDNVTEKSYRSIATTLIPYKITSRFNAVLTRLKCPLSVQFQKHTQWFPQMSLITVTR